MTLTWATLGTGVVLLAVGFLLFRYPEPVRRGLTAFPRSRPATLVLLILATALVLLNVRQLGEADFGKYKDLLTVFFLVLAVGSWFRVPDFLGIRALTVLGLLLSGQLLASAFLQPPTSRLFLVVFAYAVIVLCLYLAAVPYRFRDGVSLLNGRDSLRKGLGAGLSGYGLLLLVVGVTYPG